MSPGWSNLGLISCPSSRCHRSYSTCGIISCNIMPKVTEHSVTPLALPKLPAGQDITSSNPVVPSCRSQFWSVVRISCFSGEIISNLECLRARFRILVISLLDVERPPQWQTATREAVPTAPRAPLPTLSRPCLITLKSSPRVSWT